MQSSQTYLSSISSFYSIFLPDPFPPSAQLRSFFCVLNQCHAIHCNQLHYQIGLSKKIVSDGLTHDFILHRFPIEPEGNFPAFAKPSGFATPSRPSNCFLLMGLAGNLTANPDTFTSVLKIFKFYSYKTRANPLRIKNQVFLL